LRRLLNHKILVAFIFWTFVASAAYVTVRLVLAPVEAMPQGLDIRIKSDYVLMLLQCVLGIFAMLLPGFLQHKVKINIPSGMIIAFAVFLYCAIYLGEVHNFYFRIPQWDTMLHAFSGAALAAVGFSILGILNRSESVPVSLSPVFISIFAFCFAVTLGALWEIYEFAMDYFLGTNMQKFVLESGEQLVGQVALFDTMKDMIVDSAGAFAMSAAGYVSIKKGRSWIYRLQLHAVRGESAAADKLCEMESCVCDEI